MYFASKPEAQKRADEIQQHTEQANRLLRRAGSKLIRDAVNFDELFRDVYGFKGGLGEACEDFMARLDREQRAATFREILEHFEKDHLADWGDSSKERWQITRRRLKPLEEQPATVLTTEFWSNWINELAAKSDWSNQTINDMTSMLASIWKHAVLGKLAPANPISAIKRRKVPKRAKPVYKTDEVRRLLDCALTHDRELVPYFAIAIFAGLRPESEIERLQWDDVNFEEGWIRVGTHFNNKTETRRFVPMEMNLQAWLAPWRGTAGPVAPINLVRRRRERVRGKFQSLPGTPEKHWTSLVPNGNDCRDIARHTYGSYLEAKYRDRNVVKENMGHVDFGTYEQYYRNARSPKEAEEFWAIFPPEDQRES